jgi:hypothetical protein
VIINIFSVDFALNYPNTGLLQTVNVHLTSLQIFKRMIRNYKIKASQHRWEEESVANVVKGNTVSSEGKRGRRNRTQEECGLK